MLGYGCPFKGMCDYERRANGGWKKNFCNSDDGCNRCGHRPKNAGNREIQRQNQNFKRNQSDAGIGWILIVGAIIVFVLSKVL